MRSLKRPRRVKEVTLITELKLAVEIVTPQGMTLREDDVDYVVVRLKEKEVVPGSELSIWPRHAPLLARIDSSRLRYRCEGETRDMEIGEGILQVKNNEVTIVTFISD